MSVLPHHCGKCPNRWGGYLTSHCGACHRTFTGITAFDKHREGPANARRCITPDTAGLVKSHRPYECWGLPGPDTDYWKTEEEN